MQIKRLIASILFKSITSSVSEKIVWKFIRIILYIEFFFYFFSNSQTVTFATILFRTYNILISLVLHVGRELDKPELVGCDGTSFPGRGWLSLDHVTAWNRCRWFSGVRRLRKRFDILGRSWLQTRLPELLKSRYLVFFSLLQVCQAFCRSSVYGIVFESLSMISVECLCD